MSAADRRLDELLLEHATIGLGAAESAELERLLARYPDVDRDAYERAAAAVCLASLDTSAALPDSLRARLEQQAAVFIANAAAAGR